MSDTNEQSANQEFTAHLPIINKKGLHARASARFVKCTEAYNAKVLVSRDGQSVGGDSIMGLMMLGACNGSTIEVTCFGLDAEKALADLTELVASRFGEAE